MPTYLPFIPMGQVDRDAQEKIKIFILKTTRNEITSFPHLFTVLLRDGMPLRIQDGGYWQFNRTELYAANDPDRDKPVWVPAVLSCIAQYWQLGQDQEIKDGLIEMTVKIAADLFRPLRQNLIESFDGHELTNLAINDETRALAAEYPADPLDPESAPIYRMAISAEPVDVTQSGWNIFPIGS